MSQLSFIKANYTFEGDLELNVEQCAFVRTLIDVALSGNIDKITWDLIQRR